MTRDSNDNAIVRTVIGLAQTLSLAVTAEGGNRRPARRTARDGCDYAQGYLYARPQPAGEVEARFSGCRVRHSAPLIRVPGPFLSLQNRSQSPAGT